MLCVPADADSEPAIMSETALHDSCGMCGKRGATIGCRVPACPSSFHLPCARAAKATLYSSKYLMACKAHARRFLKEVETCVSFPPAQLCAL